MYVISDYGIEEPGLDSNRKNLRKSGYIQSWEVDENPCYSVPSMMHQDLTYYNPCTDGMLTSMTSRKGGGGQSITIVTFLETLGSENFSYLL